MPFYITCRCLLANVLFVLAYFGHFLLYEVNSLLFFSVFVGDCPSGQYESQGVCINCAVGTYRDKSEGFDCKQCSSGYTTAGTGATSSANCSISKLMYKCIMIGHSINQHSFIMYMYLKSYTLISVLERMISLFFL